MAEENPVDGQSIHTGGGAYVEGEVHTGGGDFIGRDRIVGAVGEGARGLVQVIETYKERQLSQVEVAQQAEARERQALADAVAAYVQRLDQQAAAARLDPGANPYKALLEYDLQDAPLFFGRTAATQQLLDHLARDQLTVLHSESGAGKTSLLKAGLMPQLLADGQVPIYLRPYRNPVPQVLKAALLPSRADLPLLGKASLIDFLRQATDLLDGRQLVVLIDQFEELFTVQDSEARAAFVAQLAPCLDDDLLPVRWVFAVRGEWLSQLGTFRPQVRNPFENELLLRALSRAEAREVILEPAAGRSVSFEEALVERLLDDLGADAIAPPQLQLVCSTLFESLDGSHQVTQAMYDQAGGAAGILQGHLARVLQRDLPAPQRRPARRLLEALVTSHKRRALRPQGELAAELASQGVDPHTLERLLAQLVDSRLLRVAEGPDEAAERAYELAHDYLLDEIELDPEVQARKAAQELLDQKLPYYTRDRLLLSADELAIVTPHRQALALSEDALPMLRESQAAVTRRRRVTLAAAIGAVALILGSILAAFILQSNAAVERANLQATNAAEQALIAATAQAASIQAVAEADRASVAEQDALEQRDQANRQAEIARARQLSALAANQLGQDISLSLLLSVEAFQTSNLYESRNALFTGLTANPQLVKFLHGHDQFVTSLAVSPDGSLLASGSCADFSQGVSISLCFLGEIRLWDLRTGEQVALLTGHDASEFAFVQSLAFSPDSRTLASGAGDGTVILWDVESQLQLIPPISGHTRDVIQVSFSPDGRLLISSGGDEMVRFWDARTGIPDGDAILLPSAFIQYLAVSPDGSLLVTLNRREGIIYWDLETRQQVDDVSFIHGGLVESMSISPNGAWLALGNQDGSINVWNTQTGDEYAEFLGHTEAVKSLAFSPSGLALASASADNSVILWDLPPGGRQATPLTVHTDEVNAVAFSPDGSLLFSAPGRLVESKDTRIAVWDLSSRFPVKHSFSGASAGITDIVFHPTEPGLFLGTNEAVYQSEFTVGNYTPLSSPFSPLATSLAISPDGVFLSAASNVGSLRVWNLPSADTFGIFPLDVEGAFSALSFSPDGSTLAALDESGTISLIETTEWTTVQQTGRYFETAGTVSSLGFSTDGSHLIAGGELGVVVLDWQERPPVVVSNAESQGEVGGVMGTGALDIGGEAFVTIGSLDRTIALQRTSDGQVLSTIPTRHPASAAAISPDGTLLAYGEDGRFELSGEPFLVMWDIAASQPLGRPLLGHSSHVTAMAFSPDGTLLASGDGAGTAFLWDLDPVSWQERACRIANRNLTQEEWGRFFPDEAYRPTCPDLE